MGTNNTNNKILESNRFSKLLLRFNVVDWMFFVWKMSAQWQALWVICSQISCGDYWISYEALLFIGPRAKAGVLVGSIKAQVYSDWDEVIIQPPQLN